MTGRHDIKTRPVIQTSWRFLPTRKNLIISPLPFHIRSFSRYRSFWMTRKNFVITAPTQLRTISVPTPQNCGFGTDMRWRSLDAISLTKQAAKIKKFCIKNLLIEELPVNFLRQSYGIKKIDEP
jgi:hypothetical protein